MGWKDWFRKKRADEKHADGPDILPFPSVRPPEPLFWAVSVQCDADSVVAGGNHGAEFRLDLADLQRVALRTTDAGPGEEDVFWVLSVASRECLIPQGAPGEAELFDRLLTLPGFNSQAMVEAMTCTHNAEFLCWESPNNNPDAS